MKRRYLGLFILTSVLCMMINIAEVSADVDDGLVAAYDFETAEAKDITGNTGEVKISDAVWEEDGTMRFYRDRLSNIELDSAVSEGLNGAPAISVSVWFKNEGLPSQAYYLFSTQISGGKMGFEMFINATALRVCGRSCADDSWLNKKYDFSEEGRWHNFVGILDFRNKLILAYLDGEKLSHVGGGDNAAFIENKYTLADSSVKTYISSAKAQNEFNGNIDNVRIYNRRLTDSEIAELAKEKELDTSMSDKELTSLLKEKMGNAVAMAENCQFAYVNGKRIPVDYDDFSIRMYIENDRSFIPLRFLAEGLGLEVQYDEALRTAILSKDGKIIKVEQDKNSLYKNDEEILMDCVPVTKNGRMFIPVRAVSEAFDKKVLWHDGLVLVNDEELFSDNSAQSINILERIKKRLQDVRFVPPYRNHMQTAVQVAYSGEEALYIASPSIIRVSENVLIAAHDYNGAKNPMVEVIYRSEDDGKTWNKIADVKDCTWATLFYNEGALYLIGTDRVFGSVVVRKSLDLGETWTEATDKNNGLILQGGTDKEAPNYHTAPVNVTVSNGRIYRAFENATPGTDLKNYHAFIISADINSDLLRSDSWTVSNEVGIDYDLIPSDWNVTAKTGGFLEGNAVVAPNGEIWDILRTTLPPATDKVAILKLSQDGKTLSIDKEQAYATMPGGSHKFSVKYDEKSGKYIAITNENTDNTSFNQRNMLSLIYSEDLINWKVAETLIYDDQMYTWLESVACTGFQYVDFFIDGDDLRMLVRQAYDGNANYHDANRIVYYRINDFRKYIK